ncbi:MAG: uroporphyrinogen decarboxylase family protein [Atribacterota bacterium]
MGQAFLHGWDQHAEDPAFGIPEEARTCVEVLGKRGGYIIAASHEITSDCPLENLRALLEAIQEVNQSTIPLLGKIAT